MSEKFLVHIENSAENVKRSGFAAGHGGPWATVSPWVAGRWLQGDELQITAGEYEARKMSRSYVSAEGRSPRASFLAYRVYPLASRTLLAVRAR